MRYQLYEIVTSSIGNIEFQALRLIPTIEWRQYKNNQQDDNGWLHNSFESEEECKSKIQSLLDKENSKDLDFHLYGISSYGDYTILPVFKFK